MSAEPCTFVDIYGWPVLCSTADPCVTGNNTTLYRVAECGGGNPPIEEWCAGYVGHPACSTTTTTVVVEVGTPPTLPATGTAGGAVIALACAVVVAGAITVFGGRR